MIAPDPFRPNQPDGSSGSSWIGRDGTSRRGHDRLIDSLCDRAHENQASVQAFNACRRSYSSGVMKVMVWGTFPEVVRPPRRRRRHGVRKHGDLVGDDEKIVLGMVVAE